MLILKKIQFIQSSSEPLSAKQHQLKKLFAMVTPYAVDERGRTWLRQKAGIED